MAMDIDLNAISPDAKALASFLQEILDRVIRVYESFSMPIPDRRYWTLGEPAVDCEQLVVAFIQMYLGAPGDEATEPKRCQDPRSATVHVRVSRKVPVVGPGGKAPSPDAIQDYSQLVAYDAWCLMDSAANLDAWSDNFPGLGVISTVEVDAPEGGYHTTILTLTAAIP
jgi:hypothetical protein